jgi:hypothetical protein
LQVQLVLLRAALLQEPARLAPLHLVQVALPQGPVQQAQLRQAQVLPLEQAWVPELRCWSG